MHYERHQPHRRRSTAVTEIASAWTDFATDMADAFDSLVTTMTEAPAGQRRPHRRPAREYRSMCGDRHAESCHCDCCVYDADLVVYARYGERRVVPIRISNERNRTRHIRLQLSEFTTGGGSPSPVTGAIVTRVEFDLESCDHEDAVVVIGAAGTKGMTGATKASAIRESLAAAETSPDRIELELPDVDDCHVAYADLRIQGCDVRPLRLAVAVLPRSCDAHEVHCACGCC